MYYETFPVEFHFRGLEISGFVEKQDGHDMFSAPFIRGRIEHIALADAEEFLSYNLFTSLELEERAQLSLIIFNIGYLTPLALQIIKENWEEDILEEMRDRVSDL